MMDIGSWTSELILNETGNFPVGVDSDWGKLRWEGEDTTEDNCKFQILDSEDNVLIDNIKTSPFTLFGTDHSKKNIKIKVILTKTTPPPKIKNIKLSYRYWNRSNVITNNAKNIMINRTFLEAPTTTPPRRFRVGESQTSPILENSEDILNPIGAGWDVPDDVVYNTEEKTVDLVYTVYNDNLIIPNNSDVESIAIYNTDTVPLFFSGVRMKPIKKSIGYYYKFTLRYKLIRSPMIRGLLTEQGKNLFINRTFKNSPDYKNISKFTLGYTDTFNEQMTELDNEYVGPGSFEFSLFDTSVQKVTLRTRMDDITGNGETYNAIAHYTDDVTPLLVSVSKFYRNILKTENYVFNFDKKYSSISPVWDII